MAADLTPCVFCGTPRPLDVARCPTCRRGWIDSHVVAPTPRPSSSHGAEAAPGTDDSGGAAAAVASVPVAEAAASTVTEDPAEDTPPDRADDAAGPAGPPETDVDAAGVPVPPMAAGAAAAAAAVSTAPEGPAEPSPPEEEEKDADRAGSEEPVEIDVEAATTGASAAAAAGASSRPGDGAPSNDRPGDRPSNDRPVSPAPPAHPIDDASLHLDRAVDEPPPPARRGRTGQRLLIAGVVAVLIAGWFGALALITRDDPAEVTGTTTSPAASTSPALAGPSTTVPEPTTTTLGPTTTTVDPTLLTGPFPEVGNPVDISDLRLGAFAVSPIDFGDPEALGRLVATLGQPGSANTVDDGGFGLCPGEPGFTATWGPFTAVFTGTPEDGALAGYRLENEPAAHPTAGLSTLSELSLGDTIEHLESVYPDFEISYEEIDGSPHFILVRSDGVTLLWGPVSSNEPDGRVLGIYSPEPCEGGPVPSG